MIDMVGSTALMDQGPEVWIPATENVITKSRAWLHGFGPGEERKMNGEFDLQWGLQPLKIIGDCVMFYIPEQTMPHGGSALSIFSSLQCIIREPVYPRPEVRIAAAFCEHAYDLTFLRGTNDVNGKDIALTARLLAVAEPQELIINEGFYLRASASFQGLQNKNDYREFGDVSRPLPQKFKGFKDPHNTYKWCGPRLTAVSG